jgi:cell division protein FtsA
MRHTTTCGIDNGTSLTRVVVCNASGAIIGAGIVPTRGIRHGYVISRDEAADSLSVAIGDAQAESGERIRSASLAISGIGVHAEYALGTAMVTRADSYISKLDIDKAIADAEARLDLKNKSILHAFPIIFRVDGKELPTRPEGIQGFKLEVKVLFITCIQQHLDDILAVAHDAGIKVTSITATPIATHHLVLSDLQRNFGCALIDIGAETVSVAIFENGSLASTHVFGIGSLDITKDIALGLRVTPEEAENIKLGVVGFSTVNKKKLDEIVEARLSDIFELIDKYLKKIGRSGLLPAGAIITGGGAQIPMIESVAKNMLRIPVRIGFVEFPTTGTAKTSKDQRLLVAYGVATGSLDRPSSSGRSSSSRSSRTSSNSLTGDHDGFLATIKNFFKQLMP